MEITNIPKQRAQLMKTMSKRKTATTKNHKYIRNHEHIDGNHKYAIRDVREITYLDNTDYYHKDEDELNYKKL